MQIRFLLPRLALLTLAATLTACGGGGGAGSDGGSSGGSGGGPLACSEPVRKQFVLQTAREWYLFLDLLPESTDPAAFPTAEALLDHLTATAREQGKDRHFSYLASRAEENSLLGEGQFTGFGFRMHTEATDRAYVVEVFESSPALEAGLLRGDEILAIDSGSGFVAVSQLLAGDGTLSDALGPAEVGVRRGLRLSRDGVTRDTALTKRVVTIDPVSDVYGLRVLDLPGTAGVGYLNLRSYISTADSQLRSAFAQFRSRGLTDYIVDLRYNGGGLVSTAELIGDLFGGARSGGDVLSRTLYNARKASENVTRPFRPQPQSVRPVRIAFLTTGATASASEFTINTLAPWAEVAIVGEDTLGKPVGQLAFDLAGCDDRLRLVSFRNANARNESDYYDGLAATLRFACAAPDRLDRPLGDPADAMTAAALDWLRTGACGSLIAATGDARLDGRRKSTGGIVTTAPTLRQSLLPGVE